MRYLRYFRFWLMVQRGHQHDWGQTWVDIHRQDGTVDSVLSAGMDCKCGRCPTGACDGTRIPEKGWA